MIAADSSPELKIIQTRVFINVRLLYYLGFLGSGQPSLHQTITKAHVKWTLPVAFW